MGGQRWAAAHGMVGCLCGLVVVQEEGRVERGLIRRKGSRSSRFFKAPHWAAAGFYEVADGKLRTTQRGTQRRRPFVL